MSNRLGNPKPFFAEGTTVGEHAELGMARGEVGTGEHGRQEDLTEALAPPWPLEIRHGLPEAVDRPPIVALGLVGQAEVEVRQRLQDDLLVSRDECEGPLGDSEGLVMPTHDVVME